MSLDIRPVISAVVSHAAAGGYCTAWQAHEPKGQGAQPGEIVVGAWLQSIGPMPRNSSLKHTGAVVTLLVRYYLDALPPGAEQADMDAIDPKAVDAVQDLLSRLNGDFTLGGLVHAVDPLGGIAGQAMRAEAGYVTLSGKLQRIFDVTVPIVVEDVWNQAP